MERWKCGFGIWKIEEKNVFSIVRKSGILLLEMVILRRLVRKRVFLLVRWLLEKKLQNTKSLKNQKNKQKTNKKHETKDKEEEENNKKHFISVGVEWE